MGEDICRVHQSHRPYAATQLIEYTLGSKKAQNAYKKLKNFNLLFLQYVVAG